MNSENRPFTAIFNDLRKKISDLPEYSDLIDFGLGNPAVKVEKSLLDSLTTSIRNNGGMSLYGGADGTFDSRKAIAEFLAEKRKTPYVFDNNYSQILPTGGITGSIKQYFTALSENSAKTEGEYVTYKKMNVLIPTPAYAWYFKILNNARINIETIETANTDWKINGETLEKHLGTNPPPDAILLNYPNNPTGANLSKEEWQAVANVFRKYVKEHPDFRIVLDNAYRDLQFGEETGLFEVAPDLMKYGIEFNSVAKFHGYAGHDGPGFAVSQNPDIIKTLRNSMVGLGGYDDTLKAAFSTKFFSPEKIEETVSLHRRRCRFVARYINENLASTNAKHSNSNIVLEPDGAMFVFANFSGWLNKKIDHNEAREFRKSLCALLPDYKDYFNSNVFINNTINDDKDLSFYLLFKAHIMTVPGQDFAIDGKKGMLRFSLGNIGKTTNFSNKDQINDKIFAIHLHDENLEGKPLDDLRKLKTGIDRLVTSLKELSSRKQI